MFFYSPVEIWFIRHGEADYDVKESGELRIDGHFLTGKGQRQARSLADALKNITFSRGFKSPLGRAQQTALYLEKTLDMKFETVDWLKEVEDVPVDQWKRAIEELAPFNFKGNQWERIQGIEVIIEGFERIRNGLDNMLEGQGIKRFESCYRSLKENPSPRNPLIERVCCVSHSGVIQLCLAHMLNISLWKSIVIFDDRPGRVTWVRFIELNKTLVPVLAGFNQDVSNEQRRIYDER
jgi:broad specificity phosphatase PhoE